MRIVTVAMGTDASRERMLSAFRRSVEANCPKAELEVVRTNLLPQHPKLPKHCAANTQKLQLWRSAVYSNDEPFVLIDADTIVLHDLSVVFANDPYFDVAYTVRPGRLRVNAGVAFVRPNARSRDFFSRWCDINDNMYMRQPLALSGCSQFGGINQAALVWLLRQKLDCRLFELPCEKWNSVQETWHKVNGETVVVHIKSKLRELAMGRMPANGRTLRPPIEALEVGVSENETILPALEAWRRYDLLEQR